MECPKTDFDIALAMVLQEINDPKGPDGMVPSLLFFGELPMTCHPGEFGRKLTSTERGDIAKIARTEIREDLDKMLNKRALTLTCPASTNYYFNQEDEVLIRCEQGHARKQGKFMGTFKVDSLERKSKMVVVFEISNGPSRLFLIIQVNPYPFPPTLSNCLFTELNDSLHRLTSPDLAFLKIIVPSTQ